MSDSPQPSSTPVGSRWLAALNVAGSVASITGISLLALRDTPGLPGISYLIAYALGSSLFLASITGLVLAFGAGWRRLRVMTGAGLQAIYWLVGIPVAVFVAIIAAQVIVALVVPLVVLSIAGQWT